MCVATSAHLRGVGKSVTAGRVPSPFAYRIPKIRGVVDWLENDVFYVRATIEGQDWEIPIRNDEWPPGPHTHPTEGVFLSRPKRRDATWQQMNLPPITERDILRARLWAKQVLRRLSSAQA